MMLRPTHSQGDTRSRFADDYFDLTLEADSNGHVQAFQLCYNLVTDEHALAWNAKGPLRHYKVDQGEDKATVNRSPILVADGACPVETLVREFTQRADNLPPATQQLILSKIREACD